MTFVGNHLSLTRAETFLQNVVSSILHYDANIGEKLQMCACEFHCSLNITQSRTSVLSIMTQLYMP